MPLLAPVAWMSWAPSVRLAQTAVELAAPRMPSELPQTLIGTLIGTAIWVPLRMPLLAPVTCAVPVPWPPAWAAPGANSSAPAARIPTLSVLRTQVFMRRIAFRKCFGEWCAYSIGGALELHFGRSGALASFRCPDAACRRAPVALRC